MKIAGHTLGTPDLLVADALRLFADIGLDGAEIIWQDGYRSAIPESDDGLARQVGGLAGQLGLDIVCLTPYMSGLASGDDGERDRDIARFARCIEVAARLGVPAIRAYAGSYLPGKELTAREAKRRRLVEALRRLGEQAAGHGISLCIENHFSTLAVGAVETVQLVEAVGSPGVGILYDQANLAFTHQEPFPEAIAAQTSWIRHVHVKDFVFTEPDRPFTATDVVAVDGAERSVRSRVVGQGSLDWPGIISALHRSGYDGYLSLEYEYRWHPDDLPAPRDGLMASAQHLRLILDRLDGAGR